MEYKLFKKSRRNKQRVGRNKFSSFIFTLFPYHDDIDICYVTKEIITKDHQTKQQFHDQAVVAVVVVAAVGGRDEK